MTKYRLVLIFALMFVPAVSAFGAEVVIRKIEIRSSWGGLGRPQSTELIIRNDSGTYRLGNVRIDSTSVESLRTSIQEPVQVKPSLENLGLSKEWLENAAAKLAREAERNDGEESTLYRLGHGTVEQKALFRRSYTDPNFLRRVLPDIFRCCHTDDYPGVKITLSYADGRDIIISSHSQSEFMLPWKVEANGMSAETFNKNISIALVALMPERATNRDRVSGVGLALTLAEAVMRNIEDKWNLSYVETHAAEALEKIRSVYKVLRADLNLYHDVTFGVYAKNNDVEGEDNLHVKVTRQNFPPSFGDTAILLYKDGKVSGVDEFLSNASRYEDMVLTVPWLARLRARYPKWGTTLLWVHDKSLSDKALQNFAADMHRLGKDAVAEEVKQVQPQVAVLNVNYGDWWLVLPDRRMILWRYESVMGLLGWKKSDFSVQECTDYQGVTGGCVGMVISPDGEVLN